MDALPIREKAHMTPLAPHVALDLWEAGLRLAPASRAVLMLETAGVADPGALPVGLRDQALLQSYCTGDRPVDALADCPRCGTTMELVLDPRQLAVDGADGSVTVQVGGWRVVARPPTAGDLAALDGRADPAEQALALLADCVLQATGDGVDMSVSSLPAEVVSAVDEALAAADGASELAIVLTCSDCGTGWTDYLDAGLFAWHTVETTGRRLATEVHTLARAYGWTEREVLRLSPFRRHLYLSAVSS